MIARRWPLAHALALHTSHDVAPWSIDLAHSLRTGLQQSIQPVRVTGTLRLHVCTEEGRRGREALAVAACRIPYIHT
jgi:hypothetical protein